MNLDRMKEAVETCKATAMDVEAVIEDVKTTMTGLKDNYMGEDADTLQEQMGKFLEDKVGDICRNAGAMERALAQGLENARFCKDYCQHFPDALEGGANGAVNDNKEIPGNLFCDYDAVMGLMDMCTEAENLGEDIRQSTYAIERVLDLEVVSFDVESYTLAVRAECDKIERLGAHRRNLENYGDFVETTDRELAAALAGIYDTFMTPESAQRSSLAYGNIDARIKKVQDRESELSEFQMEMLYEYINKPSGSLTDEDRKAIDDILAGLFENEATDDLIKIVDSLGNGIWSAGQSYVAAKILVHSEETGNEEIASEIYNKLKREKLIWKNAYLMGDTYETTYCYEVWMDSWKVKCMLKELKPEEEGLAYYSLQRRSKYATSTRKVLPSCCSEPEYAVALSFKTVDGKLVAVFDTENGKVELASVDMNKVVGAEGIANLHREGIHFSPEQIQTLMSCIYTDEDIIFIGNLSKAYTEKDYRKVFQSDPQALSPYTLAELYGYAVALYDEGVSYDDNMRIREEPKLNQMRKFLNGMLYVKSSNKAYEEYKAGGESLFAVNHRDGYLKALQTLGEIQMEEARKQLEVIYDEEGKIDIEPMKAQLTYFAQGAQMTSLYAALADREFAHSTYGAECYGWISELGLCNSMDGLTREGDLNRVLFSYKEEIRWDDKNCTKLYEEKINNIIATVKIGKMTGSDIFSQIASRDFDEKARAAEHAISKAATDSVITIATYFSKWINRGATAADMVGNFVSVKEAYEEAEEAENEIRAALGGVQVIYMDDRHDNQNPVLILTGEYDANALIKMKVLEERGLAAVADLTDKEKEGIKDDITDKIINFDYGSGESKTDLYDQYLVFSGEAYQDEKGNLCPVQSLSDMDPNRIKLAIEDLQADYKDQIGEFNYFNCDIIRRELDKKEDEIQAEGGETE